MQPTMLNSKGISIPTDKEISLAGESSRKLTAYIKSTNAPAFQLIKKGKRCGNNFNSYRCPSITNCYFISDG
jgi:hypothetical protein